MISKQEFICLNNDNPKVQGLFNTIGEEETYRQYVLNNGRLPKNILIPFSDVKEYFNNFISTDSFKFKSIKQILSQTPAGTQAAFWRNVFYFKDAVSKQEANEELFHAVVSTILTPEERNKLYSEGAKLFNVSQRTKELVNKYPETYSILSEEDQKNRVIEEHLASLFVNSFEEPSLLDKISDFIKNVFDTIKELFGFARDRDYIETVFNNIKSGAYRNSPVFISENATPSTYIIKGATPLGITQPLGEVESEQVLRNLRAVYFDLKQNSSKVSKEDLIKQTIDVAREYYNEVNPVVSGVFVAKSPVFNFDTGTLDEIDNTDYLELIDQLNTRIEEVEGLMFDPIEEDGGDELSDENADSEYQHLGDITKDATETGFDSISRWLKMYISTVGNVIPVQIGEQTYNFIEAVDPARIYYGVARALNNSNNDFERFIKLVEFGELQGNSAAKAFRDKIIKDITGKNNAEETIQSIQNDYLNVYLKDKNPAIINNHIAPTRAYVLQNVLKGFDLWTRTNLFSTVSPETGGSSTFNANVNNAVNNQMNQWQQSYNEYNDVNKLEGLVGSVGVTSSFNQTLEQAVDNNIQLLQDAIGVNVSEEAVRWLLINSARNAPLTASQITKYNAFKSQIQTFDTNKEISSLLENIKSYAKQSGDIFDDGGIKKRLRLLAQINAVFDESVFESSYKTADGKTRYGFQWKTFDLEFMVNLQNPEFISSLMNNGLVNYRVDERGNNIYLNESQDFLHNNMFLKDMFELKNGRYVLKEDGLASLLPYMKLASIDGIRQREGKDNSEVDDIKEQIAKAVNAGNRTLANELIEKAKTLEGNESQGREGEGSTFTNMLTKDFDLLRLNYVVNETVKVGNTTLFPHYLGNLEAKRTADFVYLPELKNVVDNKGITAKGISLLKEEIRKEYDRIKRVHQELKSLIDAHPESFAPNENGEIKLSSQKLRDFLNKDVYEKYHTGTVIKNGDVYVSKGVRALEFTDSTLGIFPKDLMKELLVDAALNNRELSDVWNENNLDDTLTSHWREIFKLHYDKLVQDENLPNLDRRWKINGELDRVKFANFILGSYLNVLSFNQLIHGDPALVYKNDGADMYKRFGGRNAAIQSSETYLINPDLGITEVRNQIKYVVGNEFVSRVSFSPSNTIDQADAQNYSTTEYKRYLLWSRGKLTKFLANALDKIDVGISLTMEEQKMMQDANEFLNVDKTVAFNGVQYLKKSDFMLTKELTSVLTLDALERLSNLDPFSKEAFDIRRDENNWIARKDFEFHHNLRQAMEGWRTQNGALVKNNSKRFDLYMPISASKMLNVNVFDPSTISKENGWNNIDGSIMQIAAKNYGLQLENPAGKRAIIDPSQMIEIIFNEQSDTAEVVYNGEIRKIVSLEEEYQKYLTSRDNTMLDVAYDQLFDENDEFDAETFFPKAVRSLIKSGADPQTIQVFQSIEDGKPLLNPNIGITKDQFTNLIFAHITKGVLQQKVNGDALAHVSSYGVTPIKRIRKIKIGDKFDYTWDVVRRDTDDYNGVTYGSIPYEKLELEKQYDKENPRVVYDPTLESDVLREKLKELYESGIEYFTDELRHIKPRYEYSDYVADEGGYSVVKYNKSTGYFTESLMPSSDPDMDIIEANKYSFAVRIPSQDKHSAVNIEWIDTLPFYYGNSVVTAKEIVFLSGSDFDIDKLFIHKPHLYKYRGKWIEYGKGNKWVEYIEFLKSFSPEFSKEYNSELKAIRQRDEEMDNQYNDLRERARDIRESGQRVPQELIKEIKDFEAEYKIQKEYVDGWKPTELLKKYRFPVGIENFDNPYTINNELLKLKQLALNNDGMLQGEDAISKTPASMDSMKNLDESPLFQQDGNSIVRSTSILPAHIFNTHSEVHVKNTTGKQNINPYVNGNLGLIAAIRGKYHINKNFQFSINGHKAEFFNYRNQENQRVFDILSTLISSATDEAKEQLNATYNLNIDGAVLAKTLISLGFNFQTAILFVNQPVVQEYLRQKQNKQKTIFLEKQYKSDEEIIASIPTVNVDVEEITDELLSQWWKEGKLVGNVLPILDIVEKINNQLSLLTRFQKVKKGFGGGLRQLDQLNEAIEALGVTLDGEAAVYFNDNNPINTPKYAEDAIQMNNVINKITPKVNKISRKLLFGRQPVVKEIKDRVVSQFRNLSTQEAFNVERDIDSYISMRLYLEENDVPTELLTNNLFKRGESHQTVGQTFNKLKEEVARINREGAKTPDEERLGSLYGTSILKRLVVKTKENNDELTLDSFAKLSPEEQDTLITSFELMIKNLAYLSDDMIEYKSLPQQMFAYWVMKEGFQYRFGSVSKLFPLHMFKTHSNTIDKVLSRKKLDSIRALSQFGFKDVMTRFAQNSETRKYIKKFYNPTVKGVPTIHNNNFEYDIAKMNYLDDSKVKANYPFKYDINNGRVIEIPFYTKSQYGVPLELSVVTLEDGSKLYKESPTFYNDVYEALEDGNVNKVQYFNIKNTNSESFQSLMTIDLNYIGLVKQESVVENTYDLVKETSIQNLEIKENTKPVSSSLKEQLYENAIKQVANEVLPEWDYKYLNLPKGLSEEEQEKISTAIFEETEDFNKYKDYIKNISNYNDLLNAEQIEKEYDWVIYSNEGDSTVDAIRKYIEDEGATTFGENGYIEFSNFDRMIKDYQLGNIEEEWKELTEQRLKELGLWKLVNYNPNQLNLFEEIDSTGCSNPFEQ